MLLEAPSRMEPTLLDGPSHAIADLASDIARRAGTLGGQLPSPTLASLAGQVRIMNCYYSNLIEGHPTRPRDIDEALRATGVPPDLSRDRRREELLELALAHIRVQDWMDGAHAAGTLPDAASRAFIEEVHRRFYDGMPASFLEIRDGQDGPVRRVMHPGRPRGEGEEVSVGHHHAPSGGATVAAFLDRYAERYGNLGRLGPAQRLCAIAAAHHRLLFIHPFDDGNGRVARLVAHAMFLQAGFGAGGLWSISRGLARGLRPDAERRPAFLAGFGAVHPTGQYKMLMAHADSPRLGDLDGRGNLSSRRLAEFTEWFLAVASDQLEFMARHLSVEAIARRLAGDYAARRGLRPDAGRVLAELVRLGRFPRGTVRAIAGRSAGTATTIVRELLADGIVASDSPKGELRLNFNVEAMDILVPGLFGVEALLADAA